MVLAQFWRSTFRARYALHSGQTKNQKAARINLRFLSLRVLPSMMSLNDKHIPEIIEEDRGRGLHMELPLRISMLGDDISKISISHSRLTCSQSLVKTLQNQVRILLFE